MHASRQSGFTLVEMLTAASVLLILAGIGFPSFQEAIRGFRLTSALTAYSADLAFARAGAIGQSRKVVACPSTDGVRCMLDGDWSRGWMVFVDANGDIAPDDAESVLQVHGPLPAGIVARSAKGRPFVRYLPDGSSAGSNLTLRLCQQEQMRASVVVNNAGRIRVDRLRTPTACHAG